MQFFNYAKVVIFASLCASTLLAAKGNAIKVPLDEQSMERFSSKNINGILRALQPFGVKNLTKKHYIVVGDSALSPEEVIQLLFLGKNAIKKNLSLHQEGLPLHYQKYGISALAYDLSQIKNCSEVNNPSLIEEMASRLNCFVGVQLKSNIDPLISEMSNRERFREFSGDIDNSIERFNEYMRHVDKSESAAKRSMLDKFFRPLPEERWFCK